jgi:hypothetical protein
MFGYFVAALRLIWVIIAADLIAGGPKAASLCPPQRRSGINPQRLYQA